MDDVKALTDNLEACLNDSMLGRGQTLGNLQRRLRVDAVVGMRLLALREACYAAISALAAPREPQDEAAWLIETHRNSTLHYWTGRVIKGEDAGQWSTDVDKARRFARREDAECMITWHLDGTGRAVEHLWVGGGSAPREREAPASGERPADLVALALNLQRANVAHDAAFAQRRGELIQKAAAKAYSDAILAILAWRPSSVEREAPMEKCDDCKGTGWGPATHTHQTKCQRCEGRGVAPLDINDPSIAEDIDYSGGGR